MASPRTAEPRRTLTCIVPGVVVAVEVDGDLDPPKPFPEEQALVARASVTRRREFATGRACGRRALERLGLPVAAIGRGRHGEPLWPPDVVGSITHCHGYRACAVARSHEVASIGIDATPHAPLPDGVATLVARGTELAALAAHAAGVPADRLAFSAKEAVIKAWFPLGRTMLDFAEILLCPGPGEDGFTASVPAGGPTRGTGSAAELRGRWRADDDVVVTAVVVATGHSSTRGL